tara:strand:- start:4616 stop:4753 length:138 start_codon:yes stop_codon:yes gene_type:complete
MAYKRKKAKSGKRKASRGKSAVRGLAALKPVRRTLSKRTKSRGKK